MARVTGAGAVYEAADLFRQRCLVEGYSFLWPEYRAWTSTNIDALVDAFMGHADYGNRKFLEKLHDQLAEQPDDVLRVASDVLAFYFLFPGPETIGRQKKMESIQAVIDWRPIALAIPSSEQSMLEAAFAEGVGNTGTFFMAGRPRHLAFFLAFARGVIEGRADPFDPVSCKRLIDELKPELEGQTQSRHILLHLLFPDQFEATASETQKHQIVAAFQEDSSGAQDLDEALANIRRALEGRGEQANFSFYDPEIRARWDPDNATTDPAIDETAGGELGKTIGKDDSSPAQFWWVNQGTTYEHERAGGYLWAPKKDKRGYTRPHWTNMEKLRAGDLVVHYAKTAIRAIGQVKEPTVDAPRPAELPAEPWDEAGYFACVDYVPLKQLIRLDEIPREWRSGTALSTPDGPSPFAVDARIKQGYLYPLAKDFIDKLVDQFPDRLTPEALRAMEELRSLVSEAVEQPDSHTRPTLDELAVLTHLDRADLEELEALLLDKRQLVLEGPPGSGKTFIAEHFARYFTRLPLNGEPDERVETVQFHQSYGYEDFVQGIRPITDEHGQLQYHVLPGIFMRMCDLAARNSDQNFVLIIDEINRGNLSRIFGELLLLLEYREKRVRLPYGAVDGKDDQAYLSIPRNLYLIATMNSTDRSLALIDYALRRRFYFYRLLPVVDGRAPVLDRWLTGHGVSAPDRQRVVRLFVKLNHEVERHLGAEFQIGHSYFMRDDIATDAALERLWRRSITPLLEEYLHGARDRDTVLAELTPEALDAGPLRDGLRAMFPSPDDELGITPRPNVELTAGTADGV